MVTLREYLFGRRIVLRSPRRKDWVIAQIRRAVPSPFSLTNYGVSGGVYFGWPSLAWDRPLLSNNARPVLHGARGRTPACHSGVTLGRKRLPSSSSVIAQTSASARSGLCPGPA